MMLYPPMGDLMDKVGSRYLLVNMVAQRDLRRGRGSRDRHGRKDGVFGH